MKKNSKLNGDTHVAWHRYYVKGKVDASKVMSIDKVRMNVSPMNHIVDTRGLKN